MSFNVKIYVSDDKHNSLNGAVLSYPIIPRIGDYIDARIIPDKINHPNMYESGVYEVTKVYLMETNKKDSDAMIYVVSDKIID